MDVTKLSATLDTVVMKTEFSGVTYVRQGEQTLYQKAFGYAIRFSTR